MDTKHFITFSGLTHTKAVKRTAKCGGISTRAIYRILDELNVTGKLSNNAPVIKSRKDIMEKLDRFDKEAIERLVHQGFREVAQDIDTPYVTLSGLHKKLMDDPTLPRMSASTLQKVLHCLGYRHVTSGVDRNILLLERDDIVDWRKWYVRF